MKRLLDFCYRYKSYYKKRGMETPILDLLIFKKMREIVGGRIRLLLSGGAPLSPDTHDFVRCALGLPLVQGYGLTESCAPLPRHTRLCPLCPLTATCSGLRS